jgi:hypothetical protein
MGEPGEVHPSLRQAEVWPLSAVETVLVVTFAYLLLLIGLVAARHGRQDDPVQPRVVAMINAVRPVAVEQHHAQAPCVTAGTVPQSYADDPGVREPMAFGPPVEPNGPLSTAEVNGELWHRLCGGIGTPGGLFHGPDRRLYVAIDAAVNGRDPNRVISHAEWAAGVARFISHDALWEQAKVVTKTVPRGTRTFGMQVRPNADPLVVRTALAAGHTSRYLVLPVRSTSGFIVAVTLRLPCGFQPIF